MIYIIKERGKERDDMIHIIKERDEMIETLRSHLNDTNLRERRAKNNKQPTEGSEEEVNLSSAPTKAAHPGGLFVLVTLAAARPGRADHPWSAVRSG